MSKDLAAAIKEMQTQENTSNFVLVGHSAGGGLVQYALNEGVVGSVDALVLVAAMPNFGAAKVFDNWWGKLDKWFLLRGWFHFQHPRSPLSNTRLVHRAFFCSEYPDEEVKEFEKWMSPSESLLWPIYYISGRFVQVPSVLKRIVGWGRVTSGSISQRICVMAGSKDTLMGVTLMEQMAAEYRAGVRTAAESNKIEWPDDIKQSEQSIEEEGILESTSDCVRFVLVNGSGHHIQNDLQRDQAGEALVRFLEQL